MLRWLRLRILARHSVSWNYPVQGVRAGAVKRHWVWLGRLKNSLEWVLPRLGKGHLQPWLVSTLWGLTGVRMCQVSSMAGVPPKKLLKVFPRSITIWTRRFLPKTMVTTGCLPDSLWIYDALWSFNIAMETGPSSSIYFDDLWWSACKKIQY